MATYTHLSIKTEVDSNGSFLTELSPVASVQRQVLRHYHWDCSVSGESGSLLLYSPMSCSPHWQLTFNTYLWSHSYYTYIYLITAIIIFWLPFNSLSSLSTYTFFVLVNSRYIYFRHPHHLLYFFFHWIQIITFTFHDTFHPKSLVLTRATYLFLSLSFYVLN